MDVTELDPGSGSGKVEGPVLAGFAVGALLIRFDAILNEFLCPATVPFFAANLWVYNFACFFISSLN